MQVLFLHRYCYAMEQINGIRIEISWTPANKVSIRSQSAKAAYRMTNLINKHDLLIKFQSIGCNHISIFGEAFGGAVKDDTRNVYGNNFNFLVFDIFVNGKWLDVPEMETLAVQLGFGTVPWEKTCIYIDDVNQVLQRPSQVAIAPHCTREGIILRPLHECLDKYGKRIIAKYKNPEYCEIANAPSVGSDWVHRLVTEDEIVKCFVTSTRLQQILDKYSNKATLKLVQENMFQDIDKESLGDYNPLYIDINELQQKIFQTVEKILEEYNMINAFNNMDILEMLN